MPATKRDLIDWLADLPNDALIGIDDGGLTLRVIDREDYFEIGGLPKKRGGSHKRVLHGKCPTCGHYGEDCTGR